MTPEDYTPETICTALGVGAFAEAWRQGLPARQLRLLLTPSFDSEVCITFSEDENGSADVSVACARRQFWSSGFGGLADSERKVGLLPFAEIEAGLRGAMPIGARHGIAIDGMPLHIAYRSLAASVRVSANPTATEPLGVFVARTIGTVWSACEQARVRNALAHAGRYVGLELTLVDLGPEPARTTLAVLGAPQERAEFLDAVRAVRDRKD